MPRSPTTTAAADAPPPQPLTPRRVGALKTWFVEHRENPYPSYEDKQQLQTELRITDYQLKNWMANTRKRHWMPMRLGSRLPRCDFERALVIGPDDAAVAAAQDQPPPPSPQPDFDDLFLPHDYFDDLHQLGAQEAFSADDGAAHILAEENDNNYNNSPNPAMDQQHQEELLNLDWNSLELEDLDFMLHVVATGTANVSGVFGEDDDTYNNINQDFNDDDDVLSTPTTSKCHRHM